MNSIIARISILPRRIGEEIINLTDPADFLQKLLELVAHPTYGTLLQSEEKFIQLLKQFEQENANNLKIWKTLINYLEKFSFHGNASANATVSVNLIPGKLSDFEQLEILRKRECSENHSAPALFLNPTAYFSDSSVTYLQKIKGKRRPVFQRKKLHLSFEERRILERQLQKNEKTDFLKRLTDAGLVEEGSPLQIALHSNSADKFINQAMIEEIDQLVSEVYESFKISRGFHQDGWFLGILNYIESNMGLHPVGLLELIYQLEILELLPEEKSKYEFGDLVAALEQAILATKNRGENTLRLEDYPEIVKACKRFQNKQSFDLKYFFTPHQKGNSKGWLRLVKEEQINSHTDGDMIFADVGFREGLFSGANKYIIATEDLAPHGFDVIPLSDIEVIVFKSKMHLRSKETGKIIIPVFNGAYLPEKDPNPFLRILYFVSLQYQNSLEGILIAFQRFDSGLSLSYKNILLLPRSRKLNEFELKNLQETDVPKRFILRTGDKRYHFLSRNLRRKMKKPDNWPVTLEVDWSAHAQMVKVLGEEHHFELIRKLQFANSLPQIELPPERSQQFLKDQTFGLQITLPRAMQMKLLKELYLECMKQQEEKFESFSYLRLKTKKEELRIRFYNVKDPTLMNELGSFLQTRTKSFFLKEFGFVPYDLEPLHFKTLKGHELVNQFLAEGLGSYLQNTSQDLTQDQFQREVQEFSGFAKALLTTAPFRRFHSAILTDCKTQFLNKDCSVEEVTEYDFSQKESNVLEQLTKEYEKLTENEAAQIYLKIVHLKCATSVFAITKNFEVSVIKSLINSFP